MNGIVCQSWTPSPGYIWKIDYSNNSIQIHSHPTFMVYDENSDDFVYKKEGVQKDNHILLNSQYHFIRIYDFSTWGHTAIIQIVWYSEVIIVKPIKFIFLDRRKDYRLLKYIHNIVGTPSDNWIRFSLLISSIPPPLPDALYLTLFSGMSGGFLFHFIRGWRSSPSIIR